MRHIAIIALLLAGCKGDDDTPVDDTATESDTDTDTDADTDTDTDTDTELSVDSLTVTADVSEIGVGQVATLSAEAGYSDGSSADVTTDTTWASDDTSIADFLSGSEATGIGAGTAILTGTYEGVDGTFSLSVVALDVAGEGDLVLNELLTDGAVEGDPNGDGSTSATDDEFIELVNVSGATLDLGGVTIVERDFEGLPRHTFAEGTSVGPGEVVVVFGGGDVSTLSETNAHFVVADNDDPGEPVGLGLTNAGDTVKILAADGSTVITSLSYGDADFSEVVPAVSDASLQLDPDVTGTVYVAHTDATGSAGDYSPGTKLDGSAF